MPLTEQPEQTEPIFEMTEWEDGDVSYIHTSVKGEWIEVKGQEFVIELDEAI